MKKLLWLLLLSAAPCFGQVSFPYVQYVITAPSGTCTYAPQIQIVRSTGTAYTCNNGTWAAVSGGSGGGVSSVSAMSPLSSSGGTTPTISFPSQSSYSVLGNCTSSSAAPSFCALNINMIPNLATLYASLSGATFTGAITATTATFNAVPSGPVVAANNNPSNTGLNGDFADFTNYTTIQAKIDGSGDFDGPCFQQLYGAGMYCWYGGGGAGTGGSITHVTSDTSPSLSVSQGTGSTGPVLALYNGAASSTTAVASVDQSGFYTTPIVTIASATSVTVTSPSVIFTGSTPIATIIEPSAGSATGTFFMFTVAAANTTTTAGNVYAVYSLVPGQQYYASYNGSKWLVGTGAAGSPVEAFSASHSVTASDAGALMVYNCTAACVVTLPTPPAPNLVFTVLSIGTFLPTVTLGTSLTYNGSSTVPVFSNSYQKSVIYTDGTNWFGDSWGTFSAKIVNGVAYAANYTGYTDVSAQIDACITDAETGVNGATSHICSAYGMNLTSVTLHTSINVGDANGDPVTVLFPPRCFMSSYGSGFNGTAYANLVNQYGNTTIYAPTTEGGNQGCVFVNGNTSGTTYALYQTFAPTNASTAGNYIRMSGITFQNGTFSVPNTTTSGHDVILQFLTDNSYISDMLIVEYGAGQNPLLIGNNAGSTVSQGSPCCAAQLSRIQINGESSSAALVEINASSTTGAANGLLCESCSLDYPAPGTPILQCTDTSASHQTHITFTNLYSEFRWNNSSQVAPLFISGTSGSANACGSIDVYGQTLKNEGTYTAAATTTGLWQLNGTYNGQLNIFGLYAPFTFSAYQVIVQNNISSECASAPCNFTGNYNNQLGLFTTNQVIAGTVQAGITLSGNGTVSAPAYSWYNESTSGLFRNGTGDHEYSMGGATIFDFNSGTVTVPPSVGSVAANNVVSNIVSVGKVPTPQACSTSGTYAITQPYQGGDKKVFIQLYSCVGTVSYTFPTAFTNTPALYVPSGNPAGFASAISATTTTLTITAGSSTSGSGFLENY